MSSPTQSQRWAVRCVLCLATAVIVAGTAYLCAWLNARGYYEHSDAHVQTRRDLERLRAAIERHREKTGALPDSTDLGVVADKEVPVNEAGYPVDGWGRPLNYQRYSKDEYRLCSLGPECLPGGVGKYADLVAGKEDTWPERPGLAEFSELPEARPAQVACLLAGLVAFPLCLLQAREKSGEPTPLGRLLLANVVTAAFAVLAALMMGALHLMPGGH